MPGRQTRRGGGRGRSKPTYKWTGLQWSPTDVGTAGVAFVLAGGVEVERYGKCTVERVRGFIRCANTDSDSLNGVARLGLKMMALEINDAGTKTGDDSGLDTDEEDIAKRQLWTYYTVLEPEEDAYNDVVRIEIDVKVRIFLMHPKQELMLLADCAVNDRLRVDGYLRVLLKLP